MLTNVHMHTHLQVHTFDSLPRAASMISLRIFLVINFSQVQWTVLFRFKSVRLCVCVNYKFLTRSFQGL